ncbi:Crp/Fnr family transcriptional regulator [Dokdonella sp.]|uniref:Crp/Fnr family transcriptional regulator n=1 Tax=Dokdonella sp. TaxID=2291710 RepID=UPI0031BBD5D3|nr:Crp/Fnr family transcriptional regulator [Dokdonella sp.]
MSAPLPANPGNQLLALLPSRDRERIFADGTLAELTAGSLVWEPGERTRHVHFPMASFVSQLITVDGHTLEVGMIGDEGMCGHSLALGIDTAHLRALVQGSGTSLRCKASTFRQHLATSPALRQVMHRYIHVILVQLAQTAACMRFHTVEARLARWLLMIQDRAHADAFDMTQELLALMLGVRRVGITAAAHSLRTQELIAYTRGHITVLDRVGLEAAACVCYRSDLDIHRSMLGARRRTRV